MKSKSRTRQKANDTLEVIALRKSIGGRIKAAREERGFTQEQLAERANLTAGGRVSDYERGQYRVGLEVLQRIATAMNIPISELFNFEDSKSSQVDRKVVRDRVNELESEIESLTDQVGRVRKNIDRFKKSIK
jgi:transcriptional regulator with XRE-family HTH domain